MGTNLRHTWPIVDKPGLGGQQQLPSLSPRVIARDEVNGYFRFVGVQVETYYTDRGSIALADEQQSIRRAERGGKPFLMTRPVDRGVGTRCKANGRVIA